MDPETKKILEDTFLLAKENNVMLHKVRRVQKRQTFWSIVKIIVIVGMALGAFYYLEPYLDKALTLFNQVSGMKQSIDSNTFENALKNIRP